jgi:hypothetical protein
LEVILKTLSIVGIIVVLLAIVVFIYLRKRNRMENNAPYAKEIRWFHSDCCPWCGKLPKNHDEGCPHNDPAAQTKWYLGQTHERRDITMVYPESRAYLLGRKKAVHDRLKELRN